MSESDSFLARQEHTGGDLARTVAQVLPDASVVLRIEGDGKYVAVRDFLEAADEFATILLGAFGELGEGDVLLDQWVIEDLRIGSATLRFSPLAIPGTEDIVRATARTVASGLAALEHGEERPPHFTDDMLRAAKKMTDVLGDGVARLVVEAGDIRTDLTQRVQAAVDAFTRGVTTALGSVEGRIEALNTHDPRHQLFVIYQAGSRRRIECRFPETLKADVLGVYERRVLVWGVVKYTRSGEPTEITVEGIRVLGSSENLPTIADVVGIAPELTGGRSPAEYIRQARDGR